MSLEKSLRALQLLIKKSDDDDDDDDDATDRQRDNYN